MKGCRLPDTESGCLPLGWGPGAYWRVLSEDGSRLLKPEEQGGPSHDYSGNLTDEVWYVCTPNGLLARLCLHTVREEDDGTISIRPGDGSSNSVLVEGHNETGLTSWHGYIEHGEWSEC